MSYNYLQVLADALQKQMPLWDTSRLIPRGLLIPLDPYLRGQVRAAKKVGDAMPILVPNNTATLALQLQTQDTTITLNANTLDYVGPGFLLSLAGISIVEMISLTNNVAQLIEPAGIALDAGTQISVYAYPIKVLGDHTIPNPPLPRPDVIEIKTNVQLMKGDYLAIPATIPGTYTELEVIEIIAARKSLDPLDAADPFIWQIRINPVQQPNLPAKIQEFATSLTGIPHSLLDGETIYLRAFPAYFSKSVIIDRSYFNAPTAQIGPYVIDRVSGLVLDNPTVAPPSAENPAGENQVDVDEFCQLNLLTTDLKLWKSVTLGPRQQQPVWNSSTQAEHLVMWEVLRGRIKFETGFVILEMDKHGMCEIMHPLVPEFDPIDPQAPTFRMYSRSQTPYQIGLQLYPNAIATGNGQPPFNVKSISESYVTLVSDPNGPQATGIKIFAQGQPNQQIEIHSLVANIPTVTNVSYSILARTVGNYHWASSGLLQKPMFLSAYLTEVAGRITEMDSGRAIFPKTTPVPTQPIVGSFATVPLLGSKC